MALIPSWKQVLLAALDRKGPMTGIKLRAKAATPPAIQAIPYLTCFEDELTP